MGYFIAGAAVLLIGIVFGGAMERSARNFNDAKRRES